MDAETDGLWRVGLISTNDGARLGKLSFPKAVAERRMCFHPSGKFIGQILYAGEAINLLLMPTAGGEARVTNGLDFSPDGNQIIVSRAVETQDVVLLQER